MRTSDFTSFALAVPLPREARAATTFFTRHGVAEILNLQPRDSLAKPYQVKQFRKADFTGSIARSSTSGFLRVADHTAEGTGGDIASHEGRINAEREVV